MLFYSLALVILLLDQFFKQLVARSLPLGQSVPLFSDFLKLTYVRNTGAAFSLFVGFSSYLAVVVVLVVLLVIYFHYKLPAKSLWLQLGLSCLLGGSLGNLTDRLLHSYVIDYLDITIWPVFNFADIMINVGVFLIAFNFMRLTDKPDAPHAV
jgi:signal peptidase II